MNATYSSIRLILTTLYILCVHCSYGFTCLRHSANRKISPETRVSLILDSHTSDEGVNIDTLSPKTFNTERRLQQRLERLLNHDKHSLHNHLDNSRRRRKHVPISRDSLTKNLDTCSDDASLGEGYISDNLQNNAIRSNAPAILLDSGPGTGKTQTLAGRIAYLLRSGQTSPQNVVIMSFTKRDALALKEKAMKMLYQGEWEERNEDMKQVSDHLWCGTIHSFAQNILKKCADGSGTNALRVLSTREIRNRIRQCLDNVRQSESTRKTILYRKALEDTKQKRGMLIDYIARCMELWKEADLISTSYAYSPSIDSITARNGSELTQDDYIELTMRLGIPASAALLALEIIQQYQILHASAGTADPSDVASMAYDYLLNHPHTLHNIRSKLDHVIVDEYQDVSNSQHKLLRLVIRGQDDFDPHNPKESSATSSTSIPKQLCVLLDKEPRFSRHDNNGQTSYDVPKLMCAGDSNQSIYGWRGATPYLTIEGFRLDYPQGVVVSLKTCYRMPRHILKAANVLMGNYGSISESQSGDVSIAGAKSISQGQEALVADSLLCAPSTLQTSNQGGDRLFVEDGLISESSSSIFIQGLWDRREEAKFIASSIRKRSKERMNCCIKSLRRIMKDYDHRRISKVVSSMIDSTDVAVMVRSKRDVDMLQDALSAESIPYEGLSSKSDTDSLPRHRRTRTSLAIKPVKILTMHNAKGDEFDEVYLAGWNEGTFPHPSSVSTNRIHEERRLAYVALTRARHRVFLTYSCVTRNAYFNASGSRKDLTEQVEPSRFLFDLTLKNHSIKRVEDSDYLAKIGITWSDKQGFKEIISSKDLPSWFAKSYQAPSDFQRHEPYNDKPLSFNPETVISSNSGLKLDTADANDHVCDIAEKVEDALNEIFARKLGACGRYRPIFRDFLKAMGITRGRAIVLRDAQESHEDKAVDALLHAPKDKLTQRALSKCTTEQLGLYLMYLLLHERYGTTPIDQTEQ